MTTVVNKIGYVYKIVCNDPLITDCYVGSCQAFRTRKTAHKTACNNENDKAYNLNVYSFIRANGGWSNWNMIAIEQVEYSIKHELLMRERYHLERLRATLNKQIPSRTREEYYDEHKTEINERLKQYYQVNKESILEKHKETITCECGKSSTKCHIMRHKQSKNHKQYEKIYNFIYS